MIIDISHKDRYRLHIESEADMRDGFFSAAYRSAFSNLREIVDDTLSESSGSVEYYQDVREPNSSIIAFVGDRGAGKSSAMLSFVDSLKKGCFPKYLIKPDAGDNPARSSAYGAHSSGQGGSEGCFQPGAEEFYKQLRFVATPVIDPTRMNGNDTLLGMIVARMLAEVKGLRRHDSGAAGLDLSRDFFRKMQTVFKIIRSVREEPHPESDDTQTLEALSDAQKLRGRLHELVMSYLRCMTGLHGEQARNCFLVVPIDDLDMNMKYAMSLTEEIRKYFMIPNVVIAIAMSINQLTHIVEQHFRFQYKGMLNRISHNEPYDMAIKYLNKFVPVVRRNHLPSIAATAASGVKVEKLIPGVEQKLGERGRPVAAVTDYLLSLIYRKTGLILIKNKLGSHAVVPGNLRALIHLITLLEGMDDADVFSCVEWDCENRKKTAEAEKLSLILTRNLDVFENYVSAYHGNSVDGSSVRSNKAAIDTLTEIIANIGKEPYNNLNAFIIGSLRPLFSDKKASDFKSVFLDNIFALVNQLSSLGMGEVLYVMGHVTRVHFGREIEDLLSIISILYSIRLTRLYFLEYDGQAPGAFRETAGGFAFEPDSMSLALKSGQGGADWSYNCSFNSKMGDKTISRLLKDWGKINVKSKFLDENKIIEQNDALRKLEHLCFYTAYYGKKSGDWRTYGQPDNPYYKVPLAGYRTNVGTIDYFSANYLFCLTSALTPFKTCERLYDGIFNTEDFEINEEQALSLHSPGAKNEGQETRNEFTLSKMIAWQRRRHFLLPLYSLDFVGAVFDRMSLNYKKTRKQKIVTEADSIHAFWRNLLRSMKEVAEDAGAYIPPAFRDRLLEAVKDCPLYRSFIEYRGLKESKDMAESHDIHFIIDIISRKNNVIQRLENAKAAYNKAPGKKSFVSFMRSVKDVVQTMPPPLMTDLEEAADTMLALNEDSYTPAIGNALDVFADSLLALMRPPQKQ